MNDSKKVFRWWFGWNVEKIERWLENEERDGWHLTQISSLGVNFSFIKDEPRNVAYTIDYQVQAKDDYVQLFSDAGWELIGSGNGWYFWRAQYSGTKPRGFSDNESLIARNRRQMWLLAILIPVQLPASRFLANHLAEEGPAWIKILFGLHCALLVVLFLSLLAFFRANRRLRKENTQL